MAVRRGLRRIPFQPFRCTPAGTIAAELLSERVEANLPCAVLVTAWTQLWAVALVATAVSFRTTSLHIVTDDVIACSTLLEVKDFTRRAEQ